LNENADVANIEMMVVGNKSDLAEKRMVEEKAGREIAQKMGLEYCETSATDFELTSSAFDRLIRKILKKKKKDISDSVELSKPVQKY
jgi:GTPase SAR1 family protein